MGSIEEKNNIGHIACQKLQTFVMISKFICLAGSSAEGKEDTDDIDLIIKLPKPSKLLENKLAEQKTFSNITQGLHFVYDPAGSHGDHIPIYDLVLVRRPEFKKETPTYSYPMFGCAPTGAVMPDDDTGIRCYIHKEAERASILDAQGNHIYNYPEIETAAAQMLKPETFILGGYLKSDGKFEVKNIFRWNTTELIDVPKEDKQFFLKKFKWPDNIYPAPVPQLGIELEEISLLKAFQPLKVRAGYGEYEFNSVDALIKEWAVGENLRTGIAIEEKFDGFRNIMNRKGKEIRLYTEDKRRDRSENLVGIANDMRRLPADCILDAEIVAYDDKDKTLPRHESTRIIAAKGQVTGNIKANVFDCLWFDNKSLVNDPWTTRQEFLKKVLPKDTRYLHRVIPIIVHTEKQLKKAVKELSARQGSEGVMCKVTNSPYSLTGRTPYWSKLKMVSEVHIEVIGIRKKRIGGKEVDNFLYRGAFLKSHDSKELHPMESQHTLSPKDMQEESEWDMGNGFKRRKPGDYGYAETYGTKITAKIGDIITVTPGHILEFKGKDNLEHYSWMFPRVKNLETTLEKPDDIDDVKRIAGAKQTSTTKNFSEFIKNLKPEDFPLVVKEV